MFLDSDQEKQTVRQRTLSTKYGEVFCIEVGQIGQPLILVIHGSGPKNSCKQYEELLHEYAARISILQRFYIIAIDCPGYGKSTGSKQAIKTFPLQFMKNILEVLGYKSYYALFGHSQGGAAIFNAVYDCPTLTEYMVQERPVCGNISRFKGFEVPTLLVYDIQDQGHPLWQGKQLFKELKNSDLYTFRKSVDPYWATDNIWNLMLEFFDKYKKVGKKVMRSQSRDVESVRPRGETRESRREYSQEYKNKKMEEKESSTENVESEKEKSETKVEQKQKPYQLQQNLQKIEESALEFNIIDQKQQCSDLIIRNQNKNPVIQQEQILEKKEIQQAVEIIKLNQILQKEQIKQPSPTNQEQVLEQKPISQQIQPPSLEQQQLQNPQSKLLSQNKCSLCLQTYFHPTKINCKHMFCWQCITEAMLVNPRCPLCRCNILKREQDKPLHQLLLTNMQSSQLSKRLFSYKKFLRMMDSIVFVEVGNTATLLSTKESSFTKTKKKYSWELFVVETHNFKFESVEFNVNMGNAEAKPVKVKQAPWTFLNRGTFEFGCQIKIIPKNKAFDPLVVIYRVCLEPGKHSRKVAIRRKEFK